MVQSESQKNHFGIISIVINFTHHALAVLVTGYILYLTGEAVTVTNVHVGLCTVGYVLLMSEAFAVLSERNLWSQQVSRNNTNHLHWLLQILGAACNIAGVIVMYRVKKIHFKSIHAILGITSVGVSCFISFSGLPVLFATKLSSQVRPVVTKFIHNFLGIACFILGILSQCYGYDKKWMIQNAGEEMATVCIILTGLMALLTIIRPLKSLFSQLKSILN